MSYNVAFCCLDSMESVAADNRPQPPSTSDNNNINHMSPNVVRTVTGDVDDIANITANSDNRATSDQLWRTNLTDQSLVRTFNSLPLMATEESPRPRPSPDSQAATDVMDTEGCRLASRPHPSLDSQAATDVMDKEGLSSEGCGLTSRPGSSRLRVGGGMMGVAKASLTPAAIHFFSGNPSVEVTEGILHLYKEECVCFFIY